MTAKCKKLITDINRKNNLDVDIREYAGLLNNQYNYYAMVKMCLNYYTMKEVIDEIEDSKSVVSEDFDIVAKIIKDYIIDKKTVTDECLNQIKHVRDSVEYKMRILTAYADGYEIYEYILNRIEARIKNENEDVDIEMLSDKMFRYVFSENDTVVINSKLQLLISQLPVRMTKNKFYDIVSNTLSIYKGGEVSAVSDFADRLRTSVLITKPEGFETEYPFLNEVYNELKTADYKGMDLDTYNNLMDRLSCAASLINEDVSAYVLFQEIVNDVYAILLSINNVSDNNNSCGYKAAYEILKACTSNENIFEIQEGLMQSFEALEGVQEEVYESVMILEAILDDIITGHAEVVNKLDLENEFNKLSIIEKLLSTSLFVELDKNSISDSQIADNDFIMTLREELTEEFAKLFAENDRIVNRSIMCKILAGMPIFLNSQQEIKEYFDYVLESCKDASELTACNKLVCELIEEER